MKLTNIEAMKLALNALESAEALLFDADLAHKGAYIKVKEAIAALRQAISEADQAEREPDCVVHNADTPGHFAIITPGLPAGTKLYTAPQREWVSLTDDEIWKAEDNLNRHLREFPINFARAIEAKLKEKNFAGN